VFTYLGVILGHTAGAGAAGLAGFLLLFGTAGLAGAALGGRLADRSGPVAALVAALAMTAISLAGLGVTAALAAGWAGAAGSVAAVAGYGLGTWAVTPPQQHRLLSTGGDDRFLLALYACALYLGVALGGLAGGLALSAGHLVSTPCWIGAGTEAAALAVVAATGGRRARRGRSTAP
jgi:DHA1 family inner membrane transport protein